MSGLNDWNELCRWYLEARQDSRVWLKLQPLVHARLTSWLRKRPGKQLPRCEVTEAAEWGFMAMFLKRDHIPSWPQAWQYCSKAALGYVLDRRRQLNKLRDVWALTRRNIGAKRPAESAEEFSEFLGELLSGLGLPELDLLKAWITLHLSGSYAFRELAQEVHLSQRTLERRIHTIREFLAKRLGAMGYDMHGIPGGSSVNKGTSSQ